MGTIAKVTAGGATHLIASTAYATCTTGSTTAAKVATIQDSQDFTLINGVTIHVYFTYSNSAGNPTLNINNTGAKPIRQYSSTAPSGWGSSWREKSIVSFTYNTDLVSTGCWLMNDVSHQSALTVDFDYQYAYSEGFDTNAGTVEDAIIDVYNQTKNVNPNWSASTGISSILNKPAIPSTAADINAAPSQHTHNADEIQYTGRISAVSGNDLTDIVSNIYDQLEVMPATQINSDWTAASGVSSILNKPTIPSATDLTPKMDGTGAAGSSATFARADHVHPIDTSRASSSHAHGSITSDGKITTTSITLANGDALVVTDSSASHVIKKTSITFDGSTTTQALTKKGTWGTFVTAETNPDWNATTGVASILNKPSIPAAQVNANWTATTGVTSILNKPTIPAAQVNSNWTATTGIASILNKPSIPSTYTDVGAASAGHIHGSVTSDGKITATGVAIANGDGLVIVDSSDSSKIKKSSITFGTSATSFLTNLGTWAEPDAYHVTIDDTYGLGSNVEDAILAISDKTPIYLDLNWAEQTPTAQTIYNYIQNGSWPIIRYYDDGDYDYFYLVEYIGSSRFRFIGGTESDVIDYLTLENGEWNWGGPAYADSDHNHGKILNDGSINQYGADTIGSGDAIVFTDSSDSNKVKKSSITFDGSTTTQVLTKKGTWGSFPNPDWNATTGVSSILNKPSIVNAIDGINGVVTLKTTTIGSATAGTNISADDITTWTTNTPTQVTKKTVVTSVTPATVVTGGTKTRIPNVTGVGTLPSLSYTAKTVGSASGWSQGSMTEATYSNGILQITTGTLPTLTITNVDCDDITAWTSGTTPTLGTAISAYTALTTGAAATVSTGDSVTVTAGVAASLSYTSRSIPNISVATTTVVTGVN